MFKKFIAKIKESQKFISEVTENFKDKKKNGKITFFSILYNVACFAIMFLMFQPIFKQNIFVNSIFIPTAVVVIIILYFVLAFGSYFNFKLLVLSYNLEVDYKKAKLASFFDIFTIIICIILLACFILFKLFF